MTDSNTTTPQWEEYLKKVLAKRHDADFAPERADLARGMSSATRHRAMPYVYENADRSWRGQGARNGYMYALALAARYRNVPHLEKTAHGDKTAWLSLGRSLAHLTVNTTGDWPKARPAQRDRVARTVALLPGCTLDTAVRHLSSLLAMAEAPATRTPINFIDLARTLIYWGNGFSEASQSSRERILRDYFTCAN